MKDPAKMSENELRLEVRQLRHEMREQLCALLKAAECPNAGCWDGSIPYEVSEGVWEAQQCQWCAEKKKLLDEHG